MSRGDLFFSLANQIWRVASTPLTLIVLPLFLEPELQGYWYTFLGIASLIALADLGASNVATHMVAHESVWISISDKKEPIGPEIRINALGSIFQSVHRRIAKRAAVILPGVFIIGSYIFSTHSKDLTWFTPWIIICASFAISILNNFLLCIIEGCGKIASSQKIRATSSIAGFITLVTMLFVSPSLYSLALSSLAGSVLCLAIVLKKYGIFFAALRNSTSKKVEEQNLKKLHSLLRNTAISFFGGTIAFQTITPIVFYLKGPISAGQAGISLAIFTTIHAMSCIWLNTYIPKFCGMIAKDNLRTANNGFSKFSILTITSYLTGSALFFLFLPKIAAVTSFEERITNITNLYLIATGWLFQTMTWIIATYTRAQKEEPFHAISAITGIALFLSNILLINKISFEIFFIIFFTYCIVSLLCFALMHNKIFTSAYNRPLI
ncbi:hypothetical protein [Pseudomonas oryzihabitans]|uniref:hypothetical protein n=1 Tax=Pseudomonas oryzihabitans TaxID=47885 RepID=UPI0011A75116|nr:hypothetical protein [Pseudomonas oryzihabitans]